MQGPGREPDYNRMIQGGIRFLQLHQSLSATESKALLLGFSIPPPPTC